MTLALALAGVVALAPAAQACDDWGCKSVSLPAMSGQADYCDPATGKDAVVSWTGESWGPKTYGPVEFPVGTGQRQDKVTCDYRTEGAALAVGRAFVQDSADDAEAHARAVAEESGLLVGKCPTPNYKCEPVTVNLNGGGEYCLATGATENLTWSGTGTAYYYVVTSGYPQTFPKCPMTQDQATAAAQTAAEDDLAYDKAKVTEGATPGMCTPPGRTYSATGSAGGSVDYCTVEGSTVVVTYTGTGAATSTVSQADANYVAQQKADAAAQADLAAKTPSNAKLGACQPVGVAPVQPGTVTEPVAEVAAATVTAPAAATLPAAVPAGDGSTAPQAPVWALALLSLATVGAVASAARLAVRRNG